MRNDDIEIEKELKVIVGVKVSNVEVVAIGHLLRIFFDNQLHLELYGSWRYRSEKKILLGALDMDFYIDMPADYLDKEDKRFTKKVNSLIGKRLINCKSINSDVFFDFTSKRYIDLYSLCADHFLFSIKETI